MWRIVAVGGACASVGALWKCQRRDATLPTYCSSTETGVGEHVKSPCSSDGTNYLFTTPSPYVEAIAQSRKLICRTMIEQGIPGSVVCVTVDGKIVWSEGIGYADVENDVACSSETVMRIASISKCLTAVAAMQLWEDGLLDLDAPVQSYVPLFPYKIFDGKEVKMTCRQLLCHMAGVRHYQKASDIENNKGEFENNEYFIKEHYDSVSESLKLFSNDDLLYAPGTTFYYTTHGWTLLSAVIEGVSGMPFLDYLKNYVLSPLHMDTTGPEKNNPLLYNRARYYNRNSTGMLENTPYVDLSYKWAGGGLYSRASDLCKLGCALLLSYQSNANTSVPSIRTFFNKETHVGTETGPGVKETPFILKPETVRFMWSEIVDNADFSNNRQLGYGLGWAVQREGALVKGSTVSPFYVGHTGAAVGASSVLVILPSQHLEHNMSANQLAHQGSAEGAVYLSDVQDSIQTVSPHGVVVAVLFNLQGVRGTFYLGSKIAMLFENVKQE